MLSAGKCTVLEGGEETLFFFLVGWGESKRTQTSMQKRKKGNTSTKRVITHVKLR